MTRIKEKFALNATTLKILAAFLMFLDHIHQMWAHTGATIIITITVIINDIQQMWAHTGAPLDWLTWLGRLVFPLYLFASAEGFHYTRSRKKLLLRLLIASWLMPICTFILQQYILPNEEIQLMNNAFRTFFMAGLYMLFYEIIKDGAKAKKPGKIIGGALLFFVPILTAAPLFYIMSAQAQAPLWLIRTLTFLPSLLFVEGGPTMVMLGLWFYILRRWRLAQIGGLVMFSVILFIFNRTSPQWMMVFAAVPIALYNGEKGRGLKNFFYIYYPAHIYLLYAVATKCR